MREEMKFAFVVALMLALYIGWTAGYLVHAQSPQAVTITGGASTSTCLTPATGQTYFCIGTDDIKGSWNGAPYISLKPSSSVAGVTGITVNGATVPLTNGVAALTVPTKATVSLPAATLTGSVQ